MSGIIGCVIIAALLLLIVFWRASLIFIFNNGTTVKLRTCFITVTLIGTKKKKHPKKRKYTKKSLEKRQKTLEKTLKKKRKKKRTEKAETAKKPRFSFPDDVGDLLSLLSSFFGELIHPVIRNTRVRFRYFRLTVASPDPADTSIRYGIISQSVAYFLHVLSYNTKISKRQLRKVSIDCNFIQEKPSLELHMSVTLSVWKLLFLLIGGGLRFFERFNKFRDRNNTYTKNKQIEGHKIK